MNQDTVLRILADAGAVLTNDHFVYTKGGHGPAYINKDAVFMHTHATSELCRGIAEYFKPSNIEVVVGPVVGGALMSQWVAYHLEILTGNTVLALYADKVEDKRGNVSFVFKRGYDAFISGKNILVVEDNLTTGGSVKQVVTLSREHEGYVVGVGALCNRGGVTAEQVGCVPYLFSLANVRMENYPPGECRLCKDGVPINTKIGKGAEFVAKYGQPKAP